MLRRAFAGILVVALLPFGALAAEDGEYLTWVRHYQIQPGMEKEFVDSVKELDGPLFDGLVKEQKIISWGMLAPFTKADEDWTHAIWVSYQDWTHLDGFMHAMAANESTRSDSENDAIKARFMRMIKPGSVHDEVYRNIVTPAERAQVSGHEPTSGKSLGYIRVSHYKVPMRHEKDVADLYRKFASPVYEELRSSGAILDYAFASREVVSDTNTTHASWVLTPDLAGLDKMRAAFASAEAARSPAEQEQLVTTFEKKLDMDQYRSQILRILHISM